MRKWLRDGLLGSVLLAAGLTADARSLPGSPLPCSAEAVTIKIGGAPGTPGVADTTFYGNTHLTGYYVPDVDEIADDIPFSGTKHITGLEIAYFAPLPNGTPLDISITFYDVNSDDCTPIGQAPVGLVVLNGMPTDLSQYFTLTVDLRLLQSDFDWSASPACPPQFPNSFGWVGVKFSNRAAGWLTADGANPAGEDWVYAFGPAPEPGFYHVQGAPANFYLRLVASD